MAAFLVIDKANRIRFFEKNFLVANISPKIVFKMIFLILSNANMFYLNLASKLPKYTTINNHAIKLVDS